MGGKYFALIFLICMLFFAPASFAEDDPELPPKELIEEMLADEELPDEIKRELEDMLKSGEFDGTPAEMVPQEEVTVPPIAEEEEVEGAEVPEDAEGIEAPEESEGVEAPEEKILEAPREIKAKPQVAASTKKAAAPDSSGKISLDLKGVDIIDVLKMLSARSNMNIVAGRNVRGRVTLFLKDVDVWDAFEIILASNSLAYIKEGNIINVMTERDYEQLYGDQYYTKKDLRVYKLKYANATEVSKALNQAKSKIGKVIVDEASNSVVLVDSAKSISQMEKMILEMDVPIETKVFSLNYAKAEDIKTKLSEILTKGVGTIQVDERTNKIVVTELSKKIPEVANIIEEMDEKHKEVLIEAKIIQIQLNDQYQYGVDWRAVFNKYASTDGIRFSFDNLGNVFGGTATGGSLTIAKIAHSYLDTAIEILKTVGKTNVISSPRITVLNNEEARVLVGTEQPIVTSTTTVPEGGQSITSENVTYIDVGVELTVTPTINKDGYVTMKIKPEVSSLGTAVETAHAANAQGNYVYPVSKSQTETTVMVKDGHTIIIAGLIQDRDISDEDKVPVLGDIPLLGHLFKNKTKGSTTQAEKEELVIFLTPYIIGGSEIFPENQNTWYGDTLTQRELLERQMSMAVEDLQKKRSLVRETPLHPEKEEVDKATRLKKDVDWFRDLEEWGKLTREELEESLQLKKEEMGPDVKAELPTPTNLIPPVVGGYHSYYDGLRNRIYWVARDSYPTGLKGKREDVYLAFTLTRDGRLMGSPQVLNNVDKKLAKAAITAVEDAAPFPPFPRRMENDSQIFKIVLTYQ